jgi:hypothetical protein
MTTLLLRPDNNQPAAFVAYRDGMIALDTTCVTSAVRWFTMQAVQVCNPAAKVLAAFDTGMVYDQPMPFKPLIIALPADMIGQTPIPRGKNKRPTIPGVILAECAHVTVIKPVSLWTPAMRPAA